MRIRTIFKKTDAMRYTGHLDLFRTLERIMRRAELPLSYSEGFSPHPKMMLASALPLGCTSDHEVGDFWLNEDIPIQEVGQRMLDASPPGVQFIEIVQVDDSVEKLQNSIVAAAYRVVLLDLVADLDERVADLLDSEELILETRKKGKLKTTNYRERILKIELLDRNEEGEQQLLMTLAAHQTSNGRPDEVLNFLGINPLDCRIKRVDITFA
jgi:radical SAM-linked protein